MGGAPRRPEPCERRVVPGVVRALDHQHMKYISAVHAGQRPSFAAAEDRNSGRWSRRRARLAGQRPSFAAAEDRNLADRACDHNPAPCSGRRSRRPRIATWTRPLASASTLSSGRRSRRPRIATVASPGDEEGDTGSGRRSRRPRIATSARRQSWRIPGGSGRRSRRPRIATWSRRGFCGRPGWQRPSFAAAEDRNPLSTPGMKGGPGQRPSFAAAEDRNTFSAAARYAGQLAAAVVRGGRGSQLFPELVEHGLVGQRPSFAAAEDRNRERFTTVLGFLDRQRPSFAAAEDRNPRTASAQRADRARGSGRRSRRPRIATPSTSTGRLDRVSAAAVVLCCRGSHPGSRRGRRLR